MASIDNSSKHRKVNDDHKKIENKGQKIENDNVNRGGNRLGRGEKGERESAGRRQMANGTNDTQNFWKFTFGNGMEDARESPNRFLYYLKASLNLLFSGLKVLPSLIWIISWKYSIALYPTNKELFSLLVVRCTFCIQIDKYIHMYLTVF